MGEPANADHEGDVILARVERAPFGRLHLRTACLLGAGTFADSYDALALAAALTVIFSTLKISFLATGLLLGTGYLGQLVGAVLASAFAERYGRKALFVAAVFTFGLFGLGTALSWNFESLLVFRVLQGLGLGAEIPIASALFSELIGTRNRGRIYLNYQNLFGWGAFLAPLIAAGVLAVFGRDPGWRIVLGIGALPMLLAVLAQRLLPESPRWLINKGRLAEADRVARRMEQDAQRAGHTLARPTVRAHADTAPTRFTELFSSAYLRRTVLTWTMFATSFFIVFAFTVWLPTLYVQVGGLPPGESLLLTAVNGLAFVVSGYAFAQVADRIGRKRYFVGTYALTAAGALVGVVAVLGFGLTGWPILFAVTLVLAIGIFPVNIGLYLYSSELYPTRMRAWATGTGSGVQRLATAVAPSVVGATLSLSSDRNTGIAWVFALLLVAALIGLAVVAVLGVETARRPLELTTTEAGSPAEGQAGARARS